MKGNILDVNGKKIKQIELPGCFSQNVRGDLIAKVLEAKKTNQPYAPSPVAGKQNSASGIIVHRRHVWKSGYGRGISRVPRKIMLRRGTQFQQVGAEVPNTRGGRRAHPPKAVSMINTKKINKKELQLALMSSISATANPKMVSKKYETLREEKIEGLPFIVESKFLGLKSKEILSSLKKILGEKLFEISVRKKDVRSGRGKRRGRKYKTNAGLLFVIAEKEDIKTNVFNVKEVKSLSTTDLANGGAGRIVLYTEKAIESLKAKFDSPNKKQENKVK
jgi:large subunit ribosomal protein L4e